MEQIYLDNAATTFPKPSAVAEQVYTYMSRLGSTINRGSYGPAYQAEEVVFETRQSLCELFHGDDCRQVIFTKNATESLNVLLKGFLRAGDHVLVSGMEHNAVMRPLRQLEHQGVTFSRIPCDGEGTLQLSELPKLLRPSTKAVVMTHASNVCGTILPIVEVGAFCRTHGLRFLVDTAQTAGVCPVHMEHAHIDALAFTGHKGLMGPQGIGGFVVREDFARQLEPLLSGGTGSMSHTEELPDLLPDRFEAGTPNLPGIFGLQAGLRWLRETGVETIRRHELILTQQLLTGLEDLEKSGHLRIVGHHDCKNRVGVVSIQPLQTDPAQTAYELEERFGILTRVGLHCAPAAHKSLGTYPTGTIRFSFGWWNREDEVETTICALHQLLRP